MSFLSQSLSFRVNSVLVFGSLGNSLVKIQEITDSIIYNLYVKWCVSLTRIEYIRLS